MTLRNITSIKNGISQREEQRRAVQENIYQLCETKNKIPLYGTVADITIWVDFSFNTECSLIFAPLRINS